MIATMEEAWNWYAGVAQLAKITRQLGKRHWKNLLDAGAFARDDRLLQVSPEDILGHSSLLSNEIDDLCVLVLFSIFENIVREKILAEIKVEADPLRHVALRKAVEQLFESLDHGSFFKVLDLYKSVDADLVELVNQVRRYRNWVAHGRRTDQPAAVVLV